MRKWDLMCRPQKDKRDMLTQPERALKVSNGIKAKLFPISPRVNSVMIFSRVILYQVLVRESALGYHRSKQTLYAVLLSLECHKRNHLREQSLLISRSRLSFISWLRTCFCGSFSVHDNRLAWLPEQNNMK